jgi:hypothetical protein
MLWNALQNSKDLDEFFARIYKQSQSRWSRRERTTVKDTTDLHDYVCSLPGAGEFPLWHIGCRVRLSLNKLKKSIYQSIR